MPGGVGKMTVIYKAGLIAVAATLLALPAVAAVPTTTSVVQGGFTAAISANGRFVVYVAGDRTFGGPVFVKDRVDGSVEQADVSSSGAGGNLESVWGAISANGRFVAFSSAASNLVARDRNGSMDVFVRDRWLGTTRRVSVSSGEREGNNDSGNVQTIAGGPVISATGRFVVFESEASNLAPGERNVFPFDNDVFVRDRRTGTTTRFSGGAAPFFRDPTISADGSHLTFVGGESAEQIVVRNRVTGASRVVSVSPAGRLGNDGSFDASLSGDGRVVVFSSFASNLVPGDTNGTADVFVWTRRSGEVRRVSLTSSGAQANGTSPSISADGRFVAFVSGSSNLVPGDTNGVADVFLHDRRTDTTQRIGVDPAEAEFTFDSETPRLSANGLFIAFAVETVPPDGLGGLGSWDTWVRGPLQ
jgi:hypothetical protein